MKQVTYAGKVFMTGDAISDALFAAVAALGSSEETRAIEIPAFDGANQSRSSVSIVIGPSSEIIAMPAEWSGEELVDDDTVRSLTQLARSLSQSAHPVASHDDVNLDSVDPDFDR